MTAARRFLFPRRHARQYGDLRSRPTHSKTTGYDVTEPSTPERRRAIADGLARDCRWPDAAAMRRSLRRVLGPYYAGVPR